MTKTTKRLTAVIVVLVLLLFVAFQPRIKKESKYIVVFYSNGGTAIETIEVRSNSQPFQPKDPVRASSHFLGWYTSPDFEEETLFDFNSKLTSSVTLFAKWKVEEYSIIYELGEGSWPSTEVENLYAKVVDFEMNIVYLKFGSQESPIHPGGRTNSFQGWRTIPQNEYNALSAEEKKLYPYIEKIEPKKDNLDEIFDENKDLVLYAQYRNL